MRRGYATVVGWRRWRCTGAHSERTGIRYLWPSQSLLHLHTFSVGLRGVGHIEPNDEIGQRPAVLSLPSLVAISRIILERFERSGPRLEKMRWMRRAGNWVVITPNLPSFAPRVNSCRSGSVEEHGNNHGARTSSSWSASQCQTSLAEAIEDWPMQSDIP